MVPGWPGFDWTAAGVLKNLLLVSPDYSGEWWFARLFVLILLIAWPCCEWLSRRGMGLLAVVSAVLYSLSSYFFQLDHLCSWQACFVVGFVLGRAPDCALGRAFGDLQAGLGRGWVFPAATLALLVFLRKRLGDGMDAFLAPVFVLGVAGLAPRLTWLEKALCLCGRHSASMWLNHTFICYYFLPREFYSLGFTPLLFAALLVASLTLGMLTQPVLGLPRLAFAPLLGKPRGE